MGALRLWIRGGMLLGAGLLLAGIAVTAAQNDLGTCPEIVTQALQSVEDLCAGQPRNSACYGNTLVNAQFVDETPPGFFANEGDVVNLGLVRALETSPLGDPEDSWGVSLLSVQASLPGALPGQNALYLLLGGAQIENAVTPSTAFQSARPFPVTALTPALLLTEPRSDADPIAQVAAGETLLADAQSGDSAYVRVTVSETFGWVERSALLADSALEALPSYTPGDSFGPMQAFYLRSGIGGPQCAVAPSALVVQGPESFTVAINANGADISFGSTLILRALSLDEAKARGLARQAGQGVGGLLEVSVLDGEAVVEDEAGNPTVIKAGERSVICLSEPDDLGVDGLPNDQAITDACGGWTDPEPIPPDFRNQFALLDAFALNYPLGVFAPTPTPSITPPLPTFSPVPSQTRWPTAIPATATPIPPTAIQPTAVPPTAIPPTQPPPSVAPSLTPSVTGTLTDTPTPTATETATDTPAPTATDTVTDTPVPTDTPSETPTGIPSNTPTATLTPTRTPSGAGADIEVEDVDRSASSILEGEEVCFSVRLRNNGPDDAYDTTLSDMLPTGLTYTSSLVSQGFYDSLTDIWTMGTVLDGEEPEITVCGTADAGTAGTTLSTTAMLYASNDSSGGGNTAFLSVDVVTP